MTKLNYFSIVLFSVFFALVFPKPTIASDSPVECAKIEKRATNFSATTIPAENISVVRLESIADAPPQSIAFSQNRPDYLFIARDHYGLRELRIHNGVESDISSLDNYYSHFRESNWSGRINTFRTTLGSDAITGFSWRIYEHWPDRRFSWLTFSIAPDASSSGSYGGMMGDFGIAFDLEYVDHIPYRFSERSVWPRLTVLLKDGRLVQDSYLFDSGIQDAIGVTAIDNGSERFVVYNGSTLQFGHRSFTGANPEFDQRWCWTGTESIDYVHSERPNWLYLVRRSSAGQIILLETMSNIPLQTRNIYVDYPSRKVLDMATKGAKQFLLVEELNGMHSIISFDTPVRQ